MRLSRGRGRAFAGDLRGRAQLQETDRGLDVVVAASGVYVAMGAKKIFANPGTITSSRSA